MLWISNEKQPNHIKSCNTYNFVHDHTISYIHLLGLTIYVVFILFIDNHVNGDLTLFYPIFLEVYFFLWIIFLSVLGRLYFYFFRSDFMHPGGSMPLSFAGLSVRSSNG